MELSHHRMLDALAVAEKVTRLCHARKIPIPQFETNIWDGAVTLDVAWYRSSMKPEHGDVDVALIGDVFGVTFKPINSIGNQSVETTIDDSPVEFTIYA